MVQNALQDSDVAKKAEEAKKQLEAQQGSSFGNWFQQFTENKNGLATPTPFSTPSSPTKSGSDTIDTGSLMGINSNNASGEFKITGAKMETPRPSYAPTKDALTRDDQKCTNMSFNQAFKQYRPY